MQLTLVLIFDISKVDRMQRKLVLIIAGILLSGWLFAGTTGKVSGQVTDAQTGEPLVGANIELDGTNLGASTDIDGFFAVINIPPGRYTMIVYYLGYRVSRIENLVVNVDRTTRQDVTMQPESVELGEEIIVEAQRPAVQMDRTHSASIVSAETFELMPVTSLSEVIELQAGVVSSNGKLHFRGGRAREVAYLIDGVPVTNAFSQDGGNNVVVENAMIQELEVISGTFNAEYGSAQSGIVNIVTKSIARDFNFSGQVFAGDWLSNKSDVYLGIDDFDPIAETDIQFSASGPIVDNVLGFNFTARLNESESIDWYERRFMPYDGWRIAAYRYWYTRHNQSDLSSSQAIPIPDSLATGDGSRGPLRTHSNQSLSLKLNFIPLSDINLSYQVFGAFGETNGGYSSRRYQPDETSIAKSLSHSHFFNFKHFPTKDFFYNISYSYQFNDGESYYRKDNKIALFPGDTGIQPISAESNGFSLGTTDGFYTDAEGKNTRVKQLLSGDINWQIDKYNFVKAGFMVQQNEVNTYSWGYRATDEWSNNQFVNTNDRGEPHNFASLTYDEYWLLVLDHWENWEDTYGTTRYVRYEEDEYYLWRDYTIKPMEMAFYIQDKIEADDVIINAGVRLDAFLPFEKYPVNTRTQASLIGTQSNLASASDKYQLSPRFGISYPISEKGAFHASYGHFFQMPSYQYMYNEPLYQLNNILLEGRRLGNADLEPEKTIAYEIGLQQDIGFDLGLDVTLYYKDFRNLLGIEQVTTIDQVTYTRYVNRDYGNTKGFSISLTKRSGMITGNLNYTLAYANGSYSDPNTLFTLQTAAQIGGNDETFAERKIQSLDWDQRHTLNGTINVHQPGDWSVSLVGYLNSGQPFSPEFVDRSDIATREYRNAAAKPIQWNVDLKARKFFKVGDFDLSVFLQIDNLFDRLNHESVYASSGYADYFARLPVEQQLEIERLQQEGLFTLREVENNPGFYSNPRRVQFGFEFQY
jgi:outer membrane receptor protein involved in Fe transport